jgi:hypothetical protein
MNDARTSPAPRARYAVPAIARQPLERTHLLPPAAATSPMSTTPKYRRLDRLSRPRMLSTWPGRARPSTWPAPPRPRPSSTGLRRCSPNAWSWRRTATRPATTHAPAALQSPPRSAPSTATRDDDPAWLAYFDEAYLAARMAQCFRDVGEASHAASYARRSLDMDGRYVRGRAFNLALLATACAAQDEPERACSVGRQALDLTVRLTSAAASGTCATWCGGCGRAPTSPQCGTSRPRWPNACPQ